MNLLFARCEFPHKRCLINQPQRAPTHTSVCRKTNNGIFIETMYSPFMWIILLAARLFFIYELRENFPTQIGNVLAWNGIEMAVGVHFIGMRKRKSSPSWYITCSLNLSVLYVHIKHATPISFRRRTNILITEHVNNNRWEFLHWITSVKLLNQLFFN